MEHIDNYQVINQPEFMHNKSRIYFSDYITNERKCLKRGYEDIENSTRKFHRTETVNQGINSATIIKPATTQNHVETKHNSNKVHSGFAATKLFQMLSNENTCRRNSYMSTAVPNPVDINNNFISPEPVPVGGDENFFAAGKDKFAVENENPQQPIDFENIPVNTSESEYYLSYYYL